MKKIASLMLASICHRGEKSKKMEGLVDEGRSMFGHGLTFSCVLEFYA